MKSATNAGRFHYIMDLYITENPFINHGWLGEILTKTEHTNVEHLLKLTGAVFLSPVMGAFDSGAVRDSLSSLGQNPSFSVYCGGHSYIPTETNFLFPGYSASCELGLRVLAKSGPQTHSPPIASRVHRSKSRQTPAGFISKGTRPTVARVEAETHAVRTKAAPDSFGSLQRARV